MRRKATTLQRLNPPFSYPVASMQAMNDLSEGKGLGGGGVMRRILGVLRGREGYGLGVLQEQGRGFESETVEGMRKDVMFFGKKISILFG